MRTATTKSSPQPICGDCYEKREPARLPVAVRPEYRDRERCCDCGDMTMEGFYISAEPTAVRYPREQ